MTLLHATGFDHLTTAAQLDVKYTAINNCTAVTGIKRTGNGSLQIVNGGDFYVLIPTSVNEGVVGCAFRLTEPTAGFFHINIYSSIGIEIRISVYTTAIVVYRGGGSAELTREYLTIPTNAWHHIQVKFKLDQTTGYVVVRFNELEIINITNQDTRFYSGTTNWLQTYLGHNSGGTTHIDDLYICDLTGSINNDFLGDLEVITLFPDGNGTTSDFTGSDADSTDNYLHVDESTPDDDTSYVEDETIDNVDLYTIDNFTGTPTAIHGVQVVSYVKKTDSQSRHSRNLIRTGGTNYEGADYNLTTAYDFNIDIWEENPNTATAWTPTDINGLEIGLTVES
jgi:hypothetical protein